MPAYRHPATAARRINDSSRIAIARAHLTGSNGGLDFFFTALLLQCGLSLQSRPAGGLRSNFARAPAFEQPRLGGSAKSATWIGGARGAFSEPDVHTGRGDPEASSKALYFDAPNGGEGHPRQGLDKPELTDLRWCA